MKVNKEGFKNFEIFYRRNKGSGLNCTVEELNKIINWQPVRLQNIINKKFMQGLSDYDIAKEYGYCVSRINDLCIAFTNKVEKELLFKSIDSNITNVAFDAIACENISDAYENNCGEKLEYTVEGMNKVINGLSEKVREVLALRFIKGLTYSEISFKTTYSITYVSDVCNKCFCMFKWPGIKAQLLGNDFRALGDDDSIDELGLSVRARRILLFNEISTVGQLRRCSRSELLKIDHVGTRFVNDIIEKLNAYGVLFNFQIEEEKLAKSGTNIDRLNLKKSLIHTLNINGVYTVEQLCEYKYNELLDMSGIGVKSVSDIKSALRQFGLVENLPEIINVKAAVPREKIRNGMVTITFEFKDNSTDYKILSIT